MGHPPLLLWNTLPLYSVEHLPFTPVELPTFTPVEPSPFTPVGHAPFAPVGHAPFTPAPATTSRRGGVNRCGRLRSIFRYYLLFSTNKHDPIFIPGYQEGDNLKDEVGLGEGYEMYAAFQRLCMDIVPKVLLEASNTSS